MRRGGGVVRELAPTVLPIAAAIGVFGVVFGATSRPVIGAPQAVAASLVVFSGAMQFAMVQLLVAGASVQALLVSAVLLNARHLLLGALVRVRVGGSRARRAALAWFLIDESAGLVLASKARAAVVLLGAGGLFYFAWQAGTVLGVLGAGLGDFRDPAQAVFPVLFIGLAAMTLRGRWGIARCAFAAAVTVLASLVVPGIRDLAPAAAAIASGFIGGDT